MNLPETACISVQGPQGLLDLGGFHWGDDIIFDSNNGGLDADAGFKQSTVLLKLIVKDVLVAKCGYKPREIIFFGFGQGGMAALNTAGKTKIRCGSIGLTRSKSVCMKQQRQQSWVASSASAQDSQLKHPRH